MIRILHIAGREFASTVLTKGFIIGAVVVPAVLAVAIPVIIFIISQQKAPAVVGTIAIIDPTGEVAPRLTDYLSPQKIAERRGERARRVSEALPGMPGASEGSMDRAMEMAQGELPQLTVEHLPPGADLDQAKGRIRKAVRDDPQSTIAVAIIDDNAITKSETDETFGGFGLTVMPRLDDRIIDEIEGGLRRGVLDARYQANGFEKSAIQALTSVRQRDTTEVTETGERDSTSAMSFILPMVMMLLVLGAVFTGGQYLLTTTIEEKSNRVVEVLLSAVSPTQLMAGKIFGQMIVGLTMLTIYSGVGISALIAFSLGDLISPMDLVWMLLFFLTGYGMIASLMAAAGAAVNDLREAQAFMTPIMMFMMIPYFMMIVVPRAPNSTLSVTLSFIPPINPFIMMLRIASNAPPPLWQILLSLAVAAAGAVAAIWLAGKIFRVGMLMFGKPPNFRTLVRWVRMA
ncbi:MAG: ABC transporter permease [Phycisphaerales bacterium JB060]